MKTVKFVVLFKFIVFHVIHKIIIHKTLFTYIKIQNFIARLNITLVLLHHFKFIFFNLYLFQVSNIPDNVFLKIRGIFW